jgi:hypothetical protein
MVNSTAAFNQALSWLEKCEKDHTYCQASSSKVLPTRVIDTAPAEGTDVPRLYASSGASGQYAALSYCWGGPQPLTCRTSNVADLMHAINPHDLARTVQDAIRVTKSLRLRYLWVDSLCIIQDSEEDKAKEIKTMGTIYENAWVTILAQNAAGAEGGFLDERPQVGWEDAWFQLPYPCPSGESGRIWARPRGHFGSETNKNPLNLRAWTLQERVLSPRCLIYGAYQLQWHCRSAKYTCGGTLDGSDKRLRDILDVPHSSAPTNVLPVEDWPGQYWHHWKMTVVNYTLRDLSVPNDKLLAISALAQKYATLFKCDYVAGLWRSFLDQGLVWASASLWRHSASEKSHHDFNKHCVRPSQYRAPSWSWACVDGAKFFLATAGKHFDAEIIDCKVSVRSEEFLFGEVMGGSLTICGKLRRAFWTEIRQRGDLRGATILMRSLENPIPSGSCFPDALDEIKYNYGSISGPIWCLDMWSDPSPSHNQGVNGLVLRRITPRLFFRIGAFEVKGETGFNWFDGCPRVTLTVI